MSALAKIAQGGFAQSRWLTKAARELSQRDMLDALADAEALVAAIKADFDAILGAAADYEGATPKVGIVDGEIVEADWDVIEEVSA